MRELKLKYVINLVSDIATKAKSDEQALVRAQEAVQKAIANTNGQLGLLERTLLAMGRVGSASAQRQAEYLVGLAMRWHQVRQAADGAQVAMAKAARLGAAGAAGGYAVDRMAQKPMDYSMKLAHMANTAFMGRDVKGRIEGKAMLDAAIRAAVRTGGGTLDEAAGALDTVIASGAVPLDQALKMLPMLTKSATANNSDAGSMAAIGIRAMQSMKIPLEKLPEVFDMAATAGKLGGFELKDMARWLPSAMASAGQLGMSGTEGLRRLLASMQASVITAGTKDEAGNNVVNWLGKINSSDTATDFKKLGINLTKELAKARAQGTDPMDAFLGLVDRVASKDKEYVALKAKLDATTDKGDRKVLLESMVALLQGTAVGKVVQDRQAMMALVAEMNNKSYVRDVMEGTRKSAGENDRSFEVVAAETGFKREQALNEAAIAGQEAFNKAAPALNAVADKATELAQRFPDVATAAAGATAALGVFAAALTANSVLGMMGKGGAAAGAAGGAAGLLRGAMPWVKRAGAYGALAWGGWELGNWLGDAYVDSIKNRKGVTLTEGARASLAALSDRPLQRARGQTPLLLDMPLGDMGASGSLQPGRSTLQLGEGKLAVEVRVSDDRTTARATVERQMPVVRIDAGNTNPAGYAR